MSLKRVDGPPSLETPGRVRDLESSVGDEIQTSTSVGNRGGEATGLTVTVRGTALEQGLVSIETIRLTGGSDRETLERKVDLEPQGREGGSGAAVSAEFPEVTLAGALAEDVDLADLSDAEGREVMRAHRASRVSIYARGRALDPGEGTLILEIEVRNDDGGDVVSESSQIAVHPEPRLPGPARREDAPPHTLRQMEKRSTLFALAHFDRPIGAWASLASEAMSRWASRISDAEDRYGVVELKEPRSRPDEQLVEAEEFTDSERMADRIGELGEVYQWSAVVHPGEAGRERLEPATTGGFSYFSCGGPESKGGTEPAPAVGFWVSVEGRSDEEIEQYESALRELVDAFARSGRCLQAIMERWDWAPALSLRTLPYEIVCGLDSSGHLRVEWLERYLRAAGPDLWLGGTLWDRLEPEAVEEVARVTRLGEVRRLQLREDATLDDLEEVLAPILPGADEWDREKQ